MPAVGLVLMPRWLYSLLLRLVLPFAAVWFLWRGWRHRTYRGSLLQRLGWGLPRTQRPLWIHAASVGEVQAVAPLLRALSTRQQPLLLTASTPTGMAHAQKLFGELCAARLPDGGPLLVVLPAPWDLPGATRRFIAATQPRNGVFVETELWPNLVAAARAAQVPLVLVSARMSERSVRRYRRWAGSMMAATVRSFAAIGAQGEADRARFVQLGAAPVDVSVIGNLKFDLTLPAGLDAAGARLRAQWAAGRWVWVAGSTHPGEEEQCLAAHRMLLEQARGAGSSPPLLVMAPRRPERFDAVAQWLEASSLRVARVSGAVTADADVVLLDRMGELPAWYAAADAAFVGGSLVPVGGHNLLEPAVLGRAVLSGPHTFQAPDVARTLRAGGGLVVVRDGAELAAALRRLQLDAAAAQRQGGRAAASVAASRGASERALALVTAVLR